MKWFRFTLDMDEMRRISTHFPWEIPFSSPESHANLNHPTISFRHNTYHTWTTDLIWSRNHIGLNWPMAHGWNSVFYTGIREKLPSRHLTFMTNPCLGGVTLRRAAPSGQIAPNKSLIEHTFYKCSMAKGLGLLPLAYRFPLRTAIFSIWRNYHSEVQQTLQLSRGEHIITKDIFHGKWLSHGTNCHRRESWPGGGLSRGGHVSSMTCPDNLHSTMTGHRQKYPSFLPFAT